jgi:isopenicillin N synthase-like dioxygenase
MSTTMVEVAPATTQLELMTAYGPTCRTVSTAPPRDCKPGEIPIIDLSTIYNGPEARKALAVDIKKAAEDIGFFYIVNHGIAEDTIEKAERQAWQFFKQPLEEKQKVSKEKSKFFNGWASMGSGKISPSESRDKKEGFQWKYHPTIDPEYKDPAQVPEDVKRCLRSEDFVWEGTAHLPNFKDDVLEYWRSTLTLARQLIKVFAVALDLPEDYFKDLTSYPGADGVFNYYPGLSSEEVKRDGSIDVGLGAHTDLQCLTILWQDQVGGLQVLTNHGEWIKAAPIKNSFVVNIGDFFMRMSNGILKSTVHRVYNRTTQDRLSMPFFLGFNFNETCSVLPTCTDENNPPKYEPISCGEVSIAIPDLKADG